MPVYEYQCIECGRIEEAFQKISEAPLTSCSQCKGSLKKLISHSAFHLKGSGWYVTDYGGNKSGSETKPDAAAGSTPPKSETAAASKSDSSD